MYGFEMMLAVSPSLKKSIFDLPNAASRRKGIMQEPETPEPCRTIPGTRIRNSEQINLMWSVAWPRLLGYYKISLPRETDPYSSSTIETGAPYFERRKRNICDGTYISLDKIGNFPAIWF